MAEIATFAAGCFWGVEQAFREVDGVLDTEVGYTGGHKPNPTYEDVCRKDTGHAEAVRVTFDPEKVGFDDLLALFWKIHDPTLLNRQGPDIGDQYRTAIFYHSEKQAKAAERALAEEDSSGRHSRPVVTKIEALGDWWPAEEYHQQYFEKRGGGTCAATVKS
ncbi:MAG: peptide-methionine (S)-S-oxide reductase MsrA [Parvularculaceae bacterium]